MPNRWLLGGGARRRIAGMVAVVSVVFLADSEVQRRTIRFEPVRQLWPPAVTDGAGTVRISMEDVPPGCYEIVVRYTGSVDRWPSRGVVTLDVL